jgi:hypothetical protein
MAERFFVTALMPSAFSEYLYEKRYNPASGAPEGENVLAVFECCRGNTLHPSFIPLNPLQPSDTMIFFRFAKNFHAMFRRVLVAGLLLFVPLSPVSGRSVFLP